MKYGNILNKLLVLLTLFIIQGCAQKTTIDHSWVKPTLNKQQYSGTLVVALAENDDIRQDFETNFVNALRAEGARVDSSFHIPFKELNYDTIVAYAKSKNLDTVLVTQYVGENSQDIYHSGTTYYRLNYVYGRAYEVAHSPSYGTTNKQMMMASTLYDLETKEALWNAMSRSPISGNPLNQLSPVINVFVKQLAIDGLLAKD